MFNNKICIMLTDDEPKILRVLSDYLKLNNYFVITSSDGEQALTNFYQHNTEIDLILLDVMMPKLDGYEVLKEIRKTSSTPVIMLTAKSQEYDELKGFKLGVDDYITKPFSLNVLSVRIEAILKRTGSIANKCISLENLTINSSQRTVSINSTDVDFTRREFDLLYYLILNKDIVVSREQILNNVWGYSFDGDIRTVDTHIKQIRLKLVDTPIKIYTIYRSGYKLGVEYEEK